MTREDRQRQKEIEAQQEQLKSAKRLLATKRAKDDLIEFTKLMMPDPDDPDDPELSRYDVARHHRVIAAALQEVEAGRMPRLIITVGPRFGKSTLCSKMFPAWFMGRDPYRQTIVASYSADLAEEFGREVREIIKSPAYRQVFPGCMLRKGSASADRLQTTEGGIAAFVGVGGSGTGKGAQAMIIDDAVKNREEADSPTHRNKVWSWFTDVAMTRLMGGMGQVVIIMCMTGDTPVLMADGSEKLLRDIRPGDEVATYDKGVLSTSFVKNWASNGPDSVYEIKTTSGATVKANERHPFLVLDSEKKLKWIRTKNLLPGHEIVRVNGESGKAKPAFGKDAKAQSLAEDIVRCTTTSEGGQTAYVRHRSIRNPGERLALSADTASPWRSMIECFRRRMAFAPSASSLPEKTLGRIGVENCASITATTQEKRGLFSAMTVTLSWGIQKLLKWPWRQPAISDFTLDKIVSIKAAGTEEVFDIQIEGTENFIANGLVSHNTRWHEDDIVGRITDPTNKFYNPAIAKHWKIIHLHALAKDNDIMGREKGESLWPSRISKEYLLSQKELSPKTFSALYQGEPTPDDGEFFKADWLKTYLPHQLPKNLRRYTGSDHAVSLAQEADFTCCPTAGVDEDDNIWFLPEIYWEKRETDDVVDGMLDMMRIHKPIFWWAEKGHISKAIGPFLRKRMLEQKVFTAIIEVTPAKDKQTRAQSIQGRMAMGKVFFPAFAPWWDNAKAELLKFPHGKHDDFVDAISHIGMGINSLVAAERPAAPKNAPRTGSIEWVKKSSAQVQRQRRQRANLF